MTAVPLAQIVRDTRTTRRKFIIMPAIVPTQVQEDELVRAYMAVVRVWSVGWTTSLRAEYVNSLDEALRSDRLLRDSASGLQATIERIEAGAIQAMLVFTGQARTWAQVFSGWHLRQFISKLLYATNVNLSSRLSTADVAETVEQALARNVGLVRSVSDDIRAKISDAVFRGLQNRTPARDVAKEINLATKLGKARSLRIASDQMVKLSARLDQQRQEQVGMNGFAWMHSGKLHPRLHHLARDGKQFLWSSTVAKTDPPGYAPFCGCKARGVLQLDDSVPEDVPPTPVRKPNIDAEMRDYTVTNGQKTGTEHLWGYDELTGERTLKNVGTHNQVGLPDGMEAMLADPKRKMIIHHNHPQSSSLSQQDLNMLSQFRGLKTLYAHGHDGSTYAAELAEKSLTPRVIQLTRDKIMDKLRTVATATNVADLNRVFPHATNLALARAGRLKYTYTLSKENQAAIDRLADVFAMLEREIK